MKTPFVFLSGLVVLLAIIIIYDNPITGREKGQIKPFIDKETTIIGDFVELDFSQSDFVVRTENGKLYQITGDKLQEIITLNNVQSINKIEVTGKLFSRKVTTFGARDSAEFMIDATSYKILGYKNNKIEEPFVPKIVTVQGSLIRLQHPFCCFSIRLEDDGDYDMEEYLLEGDKIQGILLSLDSFDSIDEIKVTGLLSEEKRRIPEAGGFADWKTKVINVTSFEIISYKE